MGGMRKPQFSIYDILLLTIGSLTLLIVLLSSEDTYESWVRLGKIQSLRTAMTLSDNLFDSTSKLAVERDITLSILYAPNENILNNLRPRLEESRQGSDDSLKRTLIELQKYNFPELASLSADSEAQIATIQKLRRQVDRAIILPAGERKRELAENSFTDITALIQQTRDIWIKFIKYFINIDPVVTYDMWLKHVLSSVMEYSGRSRALIGRLIVENVSPTSNDQADLIRWQGSSDLAWELAANIIAQGGMYKDHTIEPYFKDAKSHYLTVYDMVHDSFYILGPKPLKASYPISAEFWLDMAGQTTDSLYALHEAALKETQNYVVTLEAGAKKEITVDIASLVFAICLCLYSFLVINRRVVAPINSMVGTLLAITQNRDTSFKSLSPSQQAKIDKLTQMLQDFKKNLE
jgi:hypothetical protein